VAGEARAPVVESAGGGEGGADLGHGEADGHGEGSGDEPAKGHGSRAAKGEAGVVERGDPRQHREDVEGDGEVGQHPAQVQFKQAMRREDEHHGLSEARSLTTHERWRLSSCLYPSSRRRAWSASPAGGLFPVMVAEWCGAGGEERTEE
jgi:hypothetical protein